MKWISVKDRLPENHIKCLIHSPDYRDIHYAHYWGVGIFKQCYTQYDIDFINVTDWMPLPDPPKETT